MRIVIIGGVAGGASAATRARRLSEEAEIILLERGPYVSFANCGLPYHLGGEIPERSRLLVQTPERLNARFDIDVRVNSEAVAIHRDSKEVEVRRRDGSSYRLGYDALVLSPGAEPVRPPVPGVDHPALFTLRTLPDLDRILERLPSARRALVVGAGYIGLEVAEAFRHRGLAVTLAERLPHVLALADGEMVAPLHAELRTHGVDLRLGASVTAFQHEGGGFRATFDDGSEAAFDLGVLAVGVKPETALARAAGLDIGPSSGIRVDDQLRTSDPAIWAVGDAVEVTDFATGRPALIPLAGPANRQGRIAADAILGRSSRYTASQGTAVVKVFGRTFAMTGA
ncbi:MAG TPA: FAD-dependent oxidoreductase, partial [Holophaga sp.]|nr:FAD-dependent oxidoreductase [Holophaga sp.]